MGSAPWLAAHAAEHATTNETAAAKTIPAQVLSRAVQDYSRMVDKLAAAGKVPGLATAIVSGNDVLLEKTVGVTDVDTSEPVEPSTVFRLASLSKAFTSALAGQLVRAGKLEWDTHVDDVLTYFRMRTPRATQHMTVLDLLSHRTGLPRNAYDNRLEDGIPYRKLVRQLYKVSLVCPVGQCYSYQNIAFSMFGDMVYPLTGDFFDHQIDKRIFQPLGMKTASYGRAPLEESSSWARPHLRRDGHFVSVTPNMDYYRVGPAAGVNASIRDMEKWLSAQMGGKPEVLPRSLLQRLHKPLVATPGQTRFRPWRRKRLRSAEYALGWRVYNYAGLKLVYHAGAVEGYRAIIGFLPEYDIGMVALWNCSCSLPGTLMPVFLDQVLQLSTVNWAGLKPSEPGTRQGSS